MGANASTEAAAGVAVIPTTTCAIPIIDPQWEVCGKTGWRECTRFDVTVDMVANDEDEFRFACKPGYFLVGEDELECEEGTWSAELPYCEAFETYEVEEELEEKDDAEMTEEAEVTDVEETQTEETETEEAETTEESTETEVEETETAPVEEETAEEAPVSEESAEEEAEVEETQQPTIEVQQVEESEAVVEESTTLRGAVVAPAEVIAEAEESDEAEEEIEFEEPNFDTEEEPERLSLMDRLRLRFDW